MKNKEKRFVRSHEKLKSIFCVSEESSGNPSSNFTRVNELPKKCTIRKEYNRCGKDKFNKCNSYPHGPYYYAYWKDENGKLRKKYIGTRFDESWKKSLKKRNKVCISLASH